MYVFIMYIFILEAQTGPHWYFYERYTISAGVHTAQKMKVSIEDFFSKCNLILRYLWIWSHVLKKSLTENFILCAMAEDLYDSSKLNLERSHKFFKTLKTTDPFLK